MADTPRYVLRTKDEDNEAGPWYEVFDTGDAKGRQSWPGIIAGRKIYGGRDRARAQADADWLNEIDG